MYHFHFKEKNLCIFAPSAKRESKATFHQLHYEMDYDKTKYKNWLRSGLIFGVIMFVLMQLIYPLIQNSEITPRNLLLTLPIWLLGGLAWGLSMKWWMNRKGQSPNKAS